MRQRCFASTPAAGSLSRATSQRAAEGSRSGKAAAEAKGRRAQSLSVAAAARGAALLHCTCCAACCVPCRLKKYGWDMIL